MVGWGGGGEFGGWRTLRSDAVQTRDTDLQERNASRDSWPALTHIGRIRLHKSEKVEGGGGGWSELQGMERHTGRSKTGALQETPTTLSYLKHKGGTVTGDTTKKKTTEKTRKLYQFMNTTSVSTGL